MECAAFDASELVGKDHVFQLTSVLADPYCSADLSIVSVSFVWSWFRS